MRKIFVYPSFPENIKKVLDIAFNYWWSWNREAINLFRKIDPLLFRETGHNPVKMLYTLPKEKIMALSEDPFFVDDVERIWTQFINYKREREAIFEEIGKKYGITSPIAFLSMEFGLHETLPLYAGGLGVLSGDILKGASDIGLKMIGISLFYRFGYFKQKILKGEQVEIYEDIETRFLPLKEIRDEKGEPIVIEISLDSERIKVRAFEVEVGINKLILFDTNLPENPKFIRDINTELYAYGEKRILQEIVVGFSAIELIRRMGIKPQIFHLNEGHTAFLILEMLKDFVREGFSLSEAQALLRNFIIFTTHTPVIAGIEHFKIELVEKYLRKTVESIGISFDDFIRYGFSGEDRENFWLPVFAIRFSAFINAVSKQHKEVTKKMWGNIFPKKHPSEFDVEYVSNGIHINSWISEPIEELYQKYFGKEFLRRIDNDKIDEIPDDEIWEAHFENKRRLINYVRRKMKQDKILDPDDLLVVFSRRMVAYKRPDFIIRDKEKLKKLISSGVQFIFAGKAHPGDVEGKNIIKNILNFITSEGVEDRFVFLEDYDIDMARHFVAGADVWLNIPTHALEASGTSGMKAALNGVINISTFEGWFREWFNEKNGFSISKKMENEEIEEIFKSLETALRIYKNEREKWIKMMKESMKIITSKFNIERTIENYIKTMYSPAIKRQSEITKEFVKKLKEEEEKILRCWEKIKIVEYDFSGGDIEGEEVHAICKVDFGDADPNLFTIEVFYLYDEDKFISIPMDKVKNEMNIYTFYTTFKLRNYGEQTLFIRCLPKNQFIREIHPELIKYV